MKAAIILVGGKSSRYGSYKALEVLDGKTFFERVLEAVVNVVDKVYVSVSKHTPPQIYALARFNGVEIVYDHSFPCGGPPRALLSVYLSHKHSKYLVVGTDYPFITSQTLERLYEYSKQSRLSALTPVIGGNQPLLSMGIISKRSLEHLLKACYIKQSKTRLSDAYRAAYLSGFYGWKMFSGNPKSFININKPDDLKTVEKTHRDFEIDPEIQIHIRNPFYGKIIKCIEQDEIQCALDHLWKEKELYESKGLYLLASHIKKDLVWLSSQKLD